MKNSSAKPLTLEQFWGLKLTSIPPLIFRILAGIFLIWSAVGSWDNPWISTLQILFYNLLALWGLSMVYSSLLCLVKNHLTFAVWAMGGSLKACREDFSRANICDANTRFGRDYLFRRGMKPVAWKDIRGILYWDHTIYYVSRGRKRLYPGRVSREEAERWISQAESRIRDNPHHIPTEYVPEDVLPPLRRVRRVLSYILPYYYVERKVQTHSAGTFALFLHLLNPVYPGIAAVLLYMLAVILPGASDLFPPKEAYGYAVLLFLLLFAVGGAAMLLKLPLFLLKKKRSGQLEDILRDFNQSRQVFDNVSLYVGKKYLFQANSMDIPALKDITGFSARRHNGRNYGIYYSLRHCRDPKYLSYFPRGFTPQESVEILNRCLPPRVPVQPVSRIPEDWDMESPLDPEI